MSERGTWFEHAAVKSVPYNALNINLINAPQGFNRSAGRSITREIGLIWEGMLKAW